MKTKKIISLLLIIMLFVCTVSIDLDNNIYANSNKYEGYINYTGQTGEGKYKISTPEQLNKLSQKVNSGTTYSGSEFILTNDIIYNNQSGNYIPIGSRHNPFQGLFDGNNYSIKRIKIKPNPDDYHTGCAIFGKISNATIKNLSLKESEVKHSHYTASIAIYAINSSIINCHNYSNMESEVYSAGIVERVQDCQIVSCTNSGTFGTEANIGGIVGEVLKSQEEKPYINTIINCINTTNITITGWRASDVGGIVRSNSGLLNIENSINIGNITVISEHACGEHIGGIVGTNYNDITLKRCKNIGNILTNYIAGGLIANTATNSIKLEQCCNYGNINRSDNTCDCFQYSAAGGLIGKVVQYYCYKKYYNLIINNCYNTSNITGFSCIGGLIGDGFSYDSSYIKIKNTYSVSSFICINRSIYGINFEGFIARLNEYIDYDINIINSYYLYSIDNKEYKNFENPKEFLQSKEFVETLNTEETIFAKDITNKNKGYPIFTWEIELEDIKVNGNTTLKKDSFTSLVVETNPLSINPNDLEISWELADKTLASITPIENTAGIMLKGLKKGSTVLTVTATINNKSISKDVNIVVNSPTIQTREGYYLVGQKINYDIGYFDEEDDEKYKEEYKYMHTSDKLDNITLDNSLGTINYNDMWLDSPTTTFNKVGTYEIYCRVQDNPPTSKINGFENYRYYSDQVKTKIYIHRKPIASFFIKDNILTDRSYDLDHSITHKNKGIVTWEWTYVNTDGKVLTYRTNNKTIGVNTVNKWLQDNQHISYELLLRVQDLENVWSDIKSYKDEKEINNAPTGDFNIISNEVPKWSFPLKNNLSTLLFRPKNSFFIEEKIKFIVSEFDIDINNLGFDYEWKFERFNTKNMVLENDNPNSVYVFSNRIPIDCFKFNNLPFGTYCITLKIKDKPPIPPFKMSDIKETMITKYFYIIPEIKMYSEVISNENICPGDEIILKTKTNKYVTSVKAKFEGENVNLTKISSDSNFFYWEKKYIIPESIDESGTYNITFEAYTNYGGKDQNTRKSTNNVPIDIKVLKLFNFRITDIVNHTNISYPYTKNMIENNLIEYKTGYYVTFNIDSIGIPELVKSKILVNQNFDQEISLEKIKDGETETWQGKFFTNARLDENQIISIITLASKKDYIYNFNLEENWNGDSLIVKGSALQDARINLTN